MNGFHSKLCKSAKAKEAPLSQFTFIFQQHVYNAFLHDFEMKNFSTLRASNVCEVSDVCVDTDSIKEENYVIFQKLCKDYDSYKTNYGISNKNGTSKHKQSVSEDSDRANMVDEYENLKQSAADSDNSDAEESYLYRQVLVASGITRSLLTVLNE